jgi:hypothetical protein
MKGGDKRYTPSSENEFFFVLIEIREKLVNLTMLGFGINF